MTNSAVQSKAMLQTSNMNEKSVTFKPHVEFVLIPAVDPATKHLLYYSPCEMFLMEIEVKRRMLMLRSMVEEEKKNEKKRVAIPLAESTSISLLRPVKRARMTPRIVSVVWDENTEIYKRSTLDPHELG